MAPVNLRARAEAQSQAPKIFWIFLALIPAIAAFLGAELFLQYKNMQRYYDRVDLENIYELEPFLQLRPKVNSKRHVNEQHFRGDPVSSDPKTFLIFAFGGSTTFTSYLPYDQTYPAKLEAKLRAHFPKVPIQVQNAACDFYTTKHSTIRYLFNIRHYQPDLILTMHAINDLSRSFVADRWSRPNDRFQHNYSHHLGPLARIAQRPVDYPFTRVLLWDRVTHRLQTYAAAMMGLEQPDQAKPSAEGEWKEIPVRDFKSLPVFQENMKTMIELIQARETDLIVVTQPNIYRRDLSEDDKGTLYFAVDMREQGRYPDLESMENGMRRFNQAALNIAESYKVPAVDAERQVPKTSAYFIDDVHPREAAAEIIAELLFKKIKELKLVEKNKLLESSLNAH